MTCEWVEGNLSAFLDDALEPQARENVAAHLADCSTCQGLMDDYRRDERLLRALPTVHPGDRLRERIFSSPEYAALTRQMDSPPRPLVSWKALLPAAALIALTVGAGFYAHERLTSTNTTHTPKSNTIGAPSNFAYPLAPGQRVVFLRNGALWSAPETPASGAATASAPQQLTPTSAHVVAWSVAPASGAHGGHLVAWVDGNGSLHLVRADGLASTVVAHIAPAGQQVSLVWSPDGARLAFSAVDASGVTTLRIATVSGPAITSGVQLGAPIAVTGRLAIAPVWSANSQALAWVTSGVSQGVWTTRNGTVTQVAVQADPADGQAAVTRLGWSGESVTWATQRAGQITGVFAAIPGATSATRLTPESAPYNAAALGSNGWLLAGQGALWRIGAGASAPTRVASLSGPVREIVWSPDGKRAAVLASSRLSLWSAETGLTLVSSSAADVAPAWSADGQRLAWVDGGQAVIARIQGGQSAGRVNAGAVSAPATLAWSADDGALAISDAQGVYLASADGQSFTLLTSQAPSASNLSWSTAG